MVPKISRKLVTGIAISLCPLIWAANTYTITHTNYVEIDEHSTCKEVTNNTGKSLMVPTSSSAEWSSFRTNLPTNVSLSDCTTTCPAGFVPVSGRAENLTSTFCVMQYEAKNVSGTATSQAASTPWTSINAGDAVTECRALGTGYDLMTNDQWTTMAREIENIPANWSSGTIGTGCIFTGNNGDTSSCGYDGSDPEFGTGRNTKARLQLNSGDYIWDVNGNVYEQVRGTFYAGADDSYTGAYDPGWGGGVLTGSLKRFFGPTGDYTPTGCTGDDSALDQCGVGFYYLLQWGSNSGYVRGGGYNDDGSDVFFTHMANGGPGTDPTYGFRCSYEPDYATWISYVNGSPPSNGNFESGNFSSWTQAAWDEGDWVIDSTTKYAGSYSAASPTSLTHNEAACIERTIDLSAETNNFRVQWVWKVSSEQDYDSARAVLDNEWVLVSSGERDWKMEHIILEPGSSHDFKFCYYKDSSADSGSDRIWVDNFDIIEL